MLLPVERLGSFADNCAEGRPVKVNSSDCSSRTPSYRDTKEPKQTHPNNAMPFSTPLTWSLRPSGPS